MSRRLWGACASEAGILGAALGPSRLDLKLPGVGQAPMGWGIGFYQNGDPLVRKAPRESQADKDLHEVVAELRTDLLVGHVREPTVGSLRAENTHPFRFRQWLFAHSGTIGRFAEIRKRMTGAMPSFLERSIKGETDSEVFFHLVLSFLYDKRRIEDPGVDAALIGETLAEAVQMVDALEAEAGATEGSPYLLLLSNGYVILGLRRGGRGLAYMPYEAPGRAEVRPRAVLVACEETMRGSSWQTVPDRSILIVRRDLRVEVKAF